MTQADNTRYIEYLKSDKWKSKAQARLQIDNYTCQCCGCSGTQNNPLEIHHVTYKHIYDENVYTDLVTLCHVDHATIHRMMSRITNADGRRGWKDSTAIPQVHAYNISGLYKEHKEIKNND